MLKYSLVALVIGFLMDLCFGDPYWMPHFIRLMGNTISLLERCFYKLKNKYFGGFCLVVCMVMLYGAVPMVGIYWLYRYSTIAGVVLESIICYQMLAAKSLSVESMKVYHSLAKDDVEGARSAVSMIVGRDTKVLDRDGIIRAAVETVAENTSDGEIAPLLYMAIGGAPLGMLYKAINTMDSMIGYHNERYEQFGCVAAKLDDVANYIPARVAAIIMIIASFLLGFNYKNAYKIFARDRYNHKSPNSAQTESVCAGALEVQLAGNAYYFGKLVEKPYIGDALRKIQEDDIKNANRLMYATSVLTFCILVAIKLIIIL